MILPSMTSARVPDGFPGQILLLMPRRAMTQFARRPLLSDLLVPFLGYFPRATGHYIRRPRPASPAQRILPRDHSIVIYAVAGQGWVMDDRGVSHVVQPGEAVVIPARIAHGYGARDGDPWSIYWFHFTGQRSASFLELLGAHRHVRIVRAGLNDHLVELFQELLRLRQEGYRESDLRIHSTVGARLLLTLAKLKQEGIEHQRHEPTPVERAARFMKENLHRSLTLGELATAAGLSITHLNRLFKAATGFTPVTYSTHLKIMRASRLLDATEQKIASIAAELGFEDPYTFSRVFKRVTGKSPSNYREQRRM